MKLHWILNRYMAPAGAEGGEQGGGEQGGGETVDRGDDFTPTDDDAAPKGKEASKGKDEADPDDEAAKELKAAAKRGDDAKKGLRAAGAEEGEGGEGDEEGEGDDEDEAAKKARKDSRIPAKRHTELLNKERAKRAELEKRLAQYEQGGKVAESNTKIAEAETKLTTLEKAYSDLLADGKHAEAAAKMGEIRKLERSIIEEKAEMRTAAATAQAVETVRYNTTLERVEEAYPELNPDHDDFDEDKSKEVIDLMQGLQARGKTPADALQKAVKYVMGAPKTAAQKTATEVTARVDKEEAADLAAKTAKAAERKEAAVKKAAEATGKQPPNAAKIGADSDKAGGGMDAKSVVKMSHEEFSKLDEATLSRMRGDVLA
jgi:hypothetical protein